MTQQDDITQRLNEIHADAGYLFGRVAADGACAGAMAESVRARIDAIKALLSKLRAPVADERAAFVAWLTGSYPDAYSEPEAVRLWHHEHVAALAWEERARRAALASAPVAERQYHYRMPNCTPGRPKCRDGNGYPDCPCWHDVGTGPLKGKEATATDWRDKPMAAPASAAVAGEAQQKTEPSDKDILALAGDSTMFRTDIGKVSGLPYYWGEASTVVAFARTVLDRYAAPQASAEQMQAALQKSFDMGKFYGSLPETDAEDVRNAALEEAYEAVACLYAAYYQHSKRSESDDILQALKQAGDDIRALKQPQADKDGGQQRAGDAVRDALWTLTEHNALHFGEQHSTVIQGRAALSAPQAEQGERDA